MNPEIVKGKKEMVHDGRGGGVCGSSRSGDSSSGSSSSEWMEGGEGGDLIFIAILNAGWDKLWMAGKGADHPSFHPKP